MRLDAVAASTLDCEPFEVFSRLSHLPHAVFFDSASALSPHARWSLIGAAPSEILRGSLWQCDELRDVLQRRRTSDNADRGWPLGFAAGAIDYDGAFCFAFHDNILVFDHAEQRWFTTGNLIEQMRPSYAGKENAPLHFQPHLSKTKFCGMVARALEYIAAGDIYQVNLAQKFSANWTGDPLALYEKLRHCSPSPFASYLALPDRTILSSSPESFLRMSGRQISTRPIKGTRPRRRDREADEKSAFDLITSPKEIAELIMITDLERSDLGQVCETGSVTADEILRLEQHAHVFHLTSTVSGTLREDVDQVTALAACFPGGSITGAPKKRAREIIAELEPDPRGLYTGALGYFGFNGESQFNIAIRTVILEKSVAHFHVGAGIVADSNPEAEYQETLDKAAGILLAAGGWHETFSSESHARFNSR